MSHFKALLCIEKDEVYSFPDDSRDKDALLQLWTSRQMLRKMHPQAFDSMRPYEHHAAAEEIIAGGGSTLCRDWCLNWVRLFN